MELAHAGLVKWAQGNASARDPDSGLVAIKPSGIRLDRLQAEHVVIVDLQGKVVDGDMKPSIDTASHLYVYRHRSDNETLGLIGWAGRAEAVERGEPIGVYTTTAAALFGGAIPISEFATIGEEAIGREIVANIGSSSSILMRSHGVFAIGATVDEALKHAIYVEEEAEIVNLARQAGPLQELESGLVAEARRMYLSDYGQR